MPGRLSIFLETIDPARKKQPINNLDGLTLSYKVGPLSDVGNEKYVIVNRIVFYK